MRVATEKKTSNQPSKYRPSELPWRRRTPTQPMGSDESAADVRALPWIGKAEEVVSGAAALVRMFFGSLTLGFVTLWRKSALDKVSGLVSRGWVLPPTLLLVCSSFVAALLLKLSAHLVTWDLSDRTIKALLAEVDRAGSPQFLASALVPFLICWLFVQGGTWLARRLRLADGGAAGNVLSVVAVLTLFIPIIPRLLLLLWLWGGIRLAERLSIPDPMSFAFFLSILAEQFVPYLLLALTVVPATALAFSREAWARLRSAGYGFGVRCLVAMCTAFVAAAFPFVLHESLAAGERLTYRTTSAVTSVVPIASKFQSAGSSCDAVQAGRRMELHCSLVGKLQGDDEVVVQQRRFYVGFDLSRSLSQQLVAIGSGTSESVPLLRVNGSPSPSLTLAGADADGLALLAPNRHFVVRTRIPQEVICVHSLEIVQADQGVSIWATIEALTPEVTANVHLGRWHLSKELVQRMLSAC